jgi:hypothetical protein
LPPGGEGACGAGDGVLLSPDWKNWSRLSLDTFMFWYQMRLVHGQRATIFTTERAQITTSVRFSRTSLNSTEMFASRF